MSDPIPPHVADLMVRLKLATRRQQLDRALQRIGRLESPPHHQPQPQEHTTDPTDDLIE